MSTSSKIVVGSLRGLWLREGAYVVVWIAKLKGDHIFLLQNIAFGQVNSDITIQQFNKDSGQCNINSERVTEVPKGQFDLI